MTVKLLTIGRFKRVPRNTLTYYVTKLVWVKNLLGKYLNTSRWQLILLYNTHLNINTELDYDNSFMASTNIFEALFRRFYQRLDSESGTPRYGPYWGGSCLKNPNHRKRGPCSRHQLTSIFNLLFFITKFVIAVINLTIRVKRKLEKTLQRIVNYLLLLFRT